MLRLAVATLIVPLMVGLGVVAVAAIGCNDVDTEPAADASPPACDQGPFAFGLLPSSDTTTPACTADNNANLPVIKLLPPGGRYGINAKVNYVGSRDEQGDCNLQTVCTCTAAGSVEPPLPTDDGGADAGDAAAPAPAPSNGAPSWVCQ